VTTAGDWPGLRVTARPVASLTFTPERRGAAEGWKVRDDGAS
jgi:hypothetical protein